MSELRLRDHRQPCEHDNQTVPDYEGFRIGHWTDLGYWCPGGKEIVLRREECFRPEAHPGGHDCDGYVWVKVVEE